MIAAMGIARHFIGKGMGLQIVNGLVCLTGFLTWEFVAKGQEGKQFVGELWAMCVQYPVFSLIIFGGLFLLTAAAVHKSDQVDEKIAGKLDNAAERLRGRGQ